MGQQAYQETNQINYYLVNTTFKINIKIDIYNKLNASLSSDINQNKDKYLYIHIEKSWIINGICNSPVLKTRITPLSICIIFILFNTLKIQWFVTLYESNKSFVKFCIHKSILHTYSIFSEV